MLCPEVAKKQGEEAPTRHSMDEELQLLTVHGVLHLLGYDHEEPSEKAEMFGSRRRSSTAGAPSAG